MACSKAGCLLSGTTSNVARLVHTKRPNDDRYAVPPFQILTDCPALADHAMTSLLRANIRICRAFPGSVANYHNDDLGGKFLALAAWLAQQTPGSADGKVALWVVRFEQAQLVSAYDAGIWIGNALHQGNRSAATMFDAMLDVLEDTLAAQPFHFDANVTFLAACFSLNETEQRLLYLAACAELSGFGFTYLDIQRPASRLHRALALAIDTDTANVSSAMQWNGALARSGLLANAFDGTVALDATLALSRFGKLAFREPYTSGVKLFDAILQPLPDPAHSIPLVWPALLNEERVLRVLLQAATTNAERGVNILLHGRPGTGKTEFARQLIAACEADGYQVPFSDPDGCEATRAERLASLHAAQCMLGQGRASVLVLDEAEDIFLNDPFAQFFAQGKQAVSKAWINHLLETNPHPVIWLTNSIDGIDTAYLRRFAFTVHFAVPERTVREKIAQTHFACTDISHELTALVARREEFSAAHIATCARVVRLTADCGIPDDEIALCQLNGQAHVMAANPLAPVPPALFIFDVAYLRLEGRLQAQEIIDAVARCGTGSVLMSGPPGTGKTELANLIAEKLGRELLRRTAADINRPYFGESEQQIARLFDDCRPDRQILFLDEADAVLTQREAGLHRASYAVTTEFLRRLDDFRGVFLCATNHVAAIDSALARRFAFRLSFKPLSAEQREALLCRVLGNTANAVIVLPEESKARLARLDGLTPGDYANVARRFTLLGVRPDICSWIAELEEEWRAKPDVGSGRTIGFA